MSTGRLLILDASLNRRLANELKGRGRRALAAGEIGLGRATDAELLRGLARRYPDEEWVLVTADDYLPAEQADLLGQLDITVATIEWRMAPPASGREQAARDACHRWAHAMAVQAPGSIRRYSAERNRAWSPRLR